LGLLAGLEVVPEVELLVECEVLPLRRAFLVLDSSSLASPCVRHVAVFRLPLTVTLTHKELPRLRTPIHFTCIRDRVAHFLL
jgi:hypothetical protein